MAEVVGLVTEAGEILILLASEAAPRTTANFRRYVEAGAYDGGAFFRVARPEAGDGRPPIDVIQARARSDVADLPPVALETTQATGLRHTRGTISMARGAAADSATWGFFIVAGDSPELDFGGRRHPDGLGFAAFGRVVAGLAVVDAIRQAPSVGEFFSRPPAIERAELVADD